MIILRDICGCMYPHPSGYRVRELLEDVHRPRADMTVCAVELLEVPGKTFTMVQYSGPDAQKVRYLPIFPVL